MADINYQAKCPRGAEINVSGYSAEVRTHAYEWNKVHKLHMSRSIAARCINEVTEQEKAAKPPVLVWPSTYGTSTGPLLMPPEPGTKLEDWTVTFDTNTVTGVTTVDYKRKRKPGYTANGMMEMRDDGLR